MGALLAWHVPCGLHQQPPCRVGTGISDDDLVYIRDRLRSVFARPYTVSPLDAACMQRVHVVVVACAQMLASLPADSSQRGRLHRA